MKLIPILWMRRLKTYTHTLLIRVGIIVQALMALSKVIKWNWIEKFRPSNGATSSLHSNDQFIHAFDVEKGYFLRVPNTFSNVIRYSKYSNYIFGINLDALITERICFIYCMDYVKRKLPLSLCCEQYPAIYTKEKEMSCSKLVTVH